MANPNSAIKDPKPVLCIDGGQSGIRAEIRLGDQIISSAETGGLLNSKPVVPQLAQIVTDILATQDAPVTTACAGLSGLGEKETAQDWLDQLADTPITTTVLAHDSITSYLGALGDTEGVVAAVGTGSVILAAGPGGVFRVDGWGHLLGDAGSGYWIGRAGLDLVMRAWDGRAEATKLTEVVLGNYPKLDQAYLQIQADPNRVAKIASYSKQVAQLAVEDAGCRKIMTDAAHQLAKSCQAGLQRAGLGDCDSPQIGMVGKVFESGILQKSFTDEMSSKYPNAVFVRADGKGLDGAAKLAGVSPDSALASAISKATRS